MAAPKPLRGRQEPTNWLRSYRARPRLGCSVLRRQAGL